jgi:molybdopterin/thiamine biosynthesis adenylyltransferase
MYQTDAAFDYATAFARNAGMLTASEQGKLRRTRVAIPGMGGMGGGHAMALARLGVGAFSLADPDRFDQANLNRQLGATLQTVGRPKAGTMAERIRQINPEAGVRVFNEALNEENLSRFLQNADVLVDGIDFFRIDTRRLVYARCRQRGIPVVNAGPIGHGVALQVFLPRGPSFEAYFGIEPGMTRAEQLIAFGLGLGPGIQRDIAPGNMDYTRQKGPALGGICMMGAGLASTEVMKLITGKGRLAAVPNGLFFDTLEGHAVRLGTRAGLARGSAWRRIRDEHLERYPSLRAMHEKERSFRRTRAKASSTDLMRTSA